MTALVVVVSGPPCSGKSTHVAEHRTDRDLVVDLDVIAHALGYPTDHLDWAAADHPARVAALIARASVLKAVRQSRIRGTVWVIDAAGETPALAGLRLRTVALDPGRDVCLDRAQAAGRPASTLTEIARWYEQRTGALGATSQEW